MKNTFIYFTLALVVIAFAKGQQANGTGNNNVVTNPAPVKCHVQAPPTPPMNPLGRGLSVYRAPSQALESAALQLMMTEASFFVKQLKLPTPSPIQIADVKTKGVDLLHSAFLKNTNFTSFSLKEIQWGLSGFFETTNFTFMFEYGRLWFVSLYRENLVAYDKHPLPDKQPLIDDSQAHQLATQWLAAIDIDVGALDKEYRPEIKRHLYSDEGKMAELPIYNISWGSIKIDSGQDCPRIEVEILGTTKELNSIIIRDFSFSRRPLLLIPNAIELNLQPDPQPATLQKLPPPQTNSSSP